MTGSGRRRGLLVALEGIDGAGKSTLSRALAKSFRRRGYSVRVRREPADREIGRRAQEAAARDAWTGAVYFTVDRHLAAPALRRDLGRHDLVITDRSFYSTLAYQGSALPERDRRRLLQLQRSATPSPDVVVLIDLPAVDALGRVGRRATESGTGRGPLERARTLSRVVRAYRRMARAGRWVVLDGRGPRSELVRAAVRAIRPRLAPPGRRSQGNRYPRRETR